MLLEQVGGRNTKKDSIQENEVKKTSATMENYVMTQTNWGKGAAKGKGNVTVQKAQKKT